MSSCSGQTAVNENTTEATTEAVTEATTEAVTEATVKTTTEATTEAVPETTATQQENVEKKYVALTFDDGPNTTTTQQVLDKLEKYNVKASFFLIGNNITPASEASVKRAYDMGCEINNHSKTHSYMSEMTAEEIKAEIDFVNEKVKQITGEEPHFFRPPYISVGGDMFDTIDMPFISGYGCNDWDDKVSVEVRYLKLMKQVKDGAILLLHDSEGNDKTVELLDRLIPDLIAQGYEFVTVSELFNIKGVEIRPDTEIIHNYAQQTTMWG